MSDTVIIGGAPFSSQSSVDYNIKNMEESAKVLNATNWVKDLITENDQIRHFKLVSKTNIPPNKLLNWLVYDTSDEVFIWCIVKIFNLSYLVMFALSNLHENIAGYFYNKTKRWINHNPVEAKKMKFKEGKKTFPSNYGPNMVKLKNLKFADFSSDEMLGFCIYEPVERIKQLLEYPIEKFMKLDIRPISFPVAPFQDPLKENNITELDITKTKINNKVSDNTKFIKTKTYKDLMDRIKKNKDKIIEWENYYIEFIRSIENLNKKFV